ncbi:MAG: site-specific integrase [Alphaproteobacteria bacterium]|nr:site-specific integrase [Alphaproteobacteria bacterium]
MSKRITNRVVEQLNPGEIVWDNNVMGFGVRRQSRSCVYSLKARINGKQRWMTIGPHGAPWTPETARREAKRLWGEISAGVDVSAQREKRKTETVADLCDRYLSDYALQHKKAASVSADRRNIEIHVKPMLGHMSIEDVSRADIDRFKLAVKDGDTVRLAKNVERKRGTGRATGGEVIANRCLALLSKMFNLAERWGLRADGTNPTRHIEKYRETKRERLLSADELARLAVSLDAAERDATESLYAIAAIRLLLFTGARCGEILQLKWDYVDLSNRMIHLPDSKTGKKTIYLAEPAVEILEKVPPMLNNPFVFAGRVDGRPIDKLDRPWFRIRAAADLDDVRLHDLRHAFASVGAMAGLSLPIIGKLLGHKHHATTQRYAHLAETPVRAAGEAIAAQIAEAMAPKPAKSDDAA